MVIFNSYVKLPEGMESNSLRLMYRGDAYHCRDLFRRCLGRLAAGRSTRFLGWVWHGALQVSIDIINGYPNNGWFMMVYDGKLMVYDGKW